MKFGVQINRFTWPNEPHSISKTLTKAAKTIDAAGFSSIWVMDHFFQIVHVGNSDEPMLEAYSTLGFLAGITKKVTLGTMVTGVIYRAPALLVNAVTTLDVLSQGRAYLGIGAAWNEEESKGLGFPFPPVSERFEILEETLQIVNQMWRDDHTPIKTKHFNLEHPMNHPMPIQKPHPPILIGGGGEKKTLRLVAQYANAGNLFNTPDLEHKLEVLKNHCDAVGRNYNEIEKTVMSPLRSIDDASLSHFIKDCERLKQLGITHVISGIPKIEEIKPIEIIAKKVLPELKQI